MTCKVENSIEIIVITDTFADENNSEQRVEQYTNFIIHDDGSALELIELYETMMM